MKNLLFALLLVPHSLVAQDDDLYFVPERPKTKVVESKFDNAPVDYKSSSRNEDEYNRMYNYDTDTIDTKHTDINGEEEYIYDDEYDYTYSRRILRFNSPRAGYIISSPFYWDLAYNYGAYDYIYDSYYDPFYWGYGWRYGWSWGPWNSWYGPIWGWTTPHHWHHWGCGPLWSDGFHGHHHHHSVAHKHYKRGTVPNRFSSGERIRTGRTSAIRQSAIASRGSSFRLDSSDPQKQNYNSNRSRRTNQNSDGTYTRYQRSRTKDANTYRNQSRSRTQRSSEYNRPSSSRVNGTSSDSPNVRTSRSSSRSSSYSSDRSSSSSNRSSSFGSGTSRSSFGGGASRGGGSSRGGRR